MNRFPHLSQRVFNVPIALHPAKAEVIIAALADRLGVYSSARFRHDPCLPTSLFAILSQQKGIVKGLRLDQAGRDRRHHHRRHVYNLGDPPPRQTPR
jgi:hypothetical protein